MIVLQEINMSLAPSDPSIQFNEMALNPYPVYRRPRHEAPVMFAPALNRTLITKAVNTRPVKDNPILFSSNDPTTPMEQAFEAMKSSCMQLQILLPCRS